MAIVRLILLFGLALLSAQRAFAQVNTLEADNPRENARVKVGPFYLTPNIQIRELGIDSNVFNDTPGNERSDLTFTLVPQARVWIPVARRGLFKAQVATGLVWYRKFSDERSIDPQFDARAEAYLRRFTLFATGAMLYSRQRPTFELDLRTRRRETSAAGGVDFRVTPKVSMELYASQTQTSYGNDAFFLGSDLEQTLDRQSKGVAATARYRATALTTFALRAERFEDRFPGSGERNSDSVRIMPGVDFKPRALVNGSAHMGMRHLNPETEEVLPEFVGFVSDLALSYTLLGSTTFGVSHVRDVGYSYELLQPYFVSTAAGARVRQALGPKFDIVVSGDRITYAYRDLLGPENTTDAARRIDTTWNYSGSFGYRLGRETRLGLGVSHWRRDSTTRIDREFEGLRFGAMVTYGI